MARITAQDKGMGLEAAKADKDRELDSDDCSAR